MVSKVECEEKVESEKRSSAMLLDFVDLNTKMEGKGREGENAPFGAS